MKRSEKITVDLKVKDYEQIRLKQLDTTELIFKIYNNSNLVNLSGKTARLIFTRPDRGIVIQSCSVNSSTITVTLIENCVKIAGLAKIEVEINENNEIISSFYINAFIEKTSKGNVTAEDTKIYLEELEEKVQEKLEVVEKNEHSRQVQEEARQNNEEVRKSSENERKEAEIQRGSNETKRQESENERNTAEITRNEAENVRISAEIQRNESEKERVANEAERKQKETTRDEAEKSRLESEEIRKKGEETRQTAETERETAEGTRQTEEIKRETAEKERISKEEERKIAEESRVSAESVRDTAEKTRIANEEERANAENIRIANEETREENEEERKSNEEIRKTNEIARETAEGDRKNAETARETAENERESFITDLKVRVENGEFNGKDGEVSLEQMNQAIATAISGIQGFDYEIVDKLPDTGSKGIIYLIQNRSEKPNIYDEYIWINNDFEIIGTTEIDLTQYAKSEDVAKQIETVQSELQQDINNNSSEIATIKSNIETIQTDIEEAQNTATEVKAELENKVDKEEGKGLSTKDYTAEEKEKLESLSMPTGTTITIPVEGWTKNEGTQYYEYDVKDETVTSTTKVFGDLSIEDMNKINSRGCTDSYEGGYKIILGDKPLGEITIDITKIKKQVI